MHILAALQKAVDAVRFELDHRANTVRYWVPGVVDYDLHYWGPLPFELLFWVENFTPDVFHPHDAIERYIVRWRRYVFQALANRLAGDPSWHPYIHQYAERAS
jgi:hypothetical protein